MQLDVIVVGCGLAGLAAANGLRRARHRVRVFEKSEFASEVGAGITVTSNGSGVLKRWGFDFERANAVILRGRSLYDGVTMESLDSRAANTGPEPSFFNLYRPDYHAELWRMAVAEEGEGPPAIITLGAQITGLDAETGTIFLADGTSHRADLIIGADGIHSKTREIVVPNEVTCTHTGFNAYRFMGSKEDIIVDPITKKLFDAKRFVWGGYKTERMERFFIWYEVRGGDLQNYVLQYASDDVPLELKGTTPEDIKKSALEDAKTLHPDLQRVIATGRDFKPWKILIHDPLSTWIKGRILLVGDAAHPVNPMNGQGVNTSVEDGATLQVLLRDVKSKTDLAKRLRAFEDLRRNRTAVIQYLSAVPEGEEESVREKIEPFLRGQKPVLNSAERAAFIFRFDAFAAAEEELSRIRIEVPN